MAAPSFNAVLADRIDLGPQLAIFRVVPDKWVFPVFKPGQFAVLGLPWSAPRCAGSKPDEKPMPPEKFVQRAYSIASTPLVKDYIEFYITLVNEGALTPRLWNLKLADKIWMSPKISGQFVMDEIPDDQNIVFISTGTGLAPFVAMLQTFLHTSKKRKFALFHGVRQSQDLAYRSELLSMQRISPTFHYFPILSRKADDPVPWNGATGRVNHLWETGAVEKAWGFKPTPKNTHVFLCGNPVMIEEMVVKLGAEGFTEHKPAAPGTVHVERYW